MPNPPFPSVEYYTDQSFVKSVSWSTGVGVTDSVISATLGFNVTISSTVTAATTYTYPIPYMKKLRIVCQSYFYKYAYDCETKWMVFVHPVWVYGYSDWAYDRSADGPLFNSSYTVQVEDI